MSIKTSISIPDFIDPSNPESMKQWMTAVKQVIDEIARKAQSLQEEERTTLPSVNDIEEKEFVHALVGGLNYLYTKKGGVIRFIAVT